jgi:CRISPR system Cascade subunit CasD
MTASRSTILLRLEAPMQAWGDGSRFQLRRTADAPTKSGVIGLILCASGTSRIEAGPLLTELRALRFGVRVDRSGTRGWDYHTAGAGYGIHSAEGKVKRTSTTGEPETLLSRREYLFDASFVAGLEGATEAIERIAGWLNEPVWPVFLGRKCCVPTLPVLERVLPGVNLLDGLALPPWHIGIADHPTDGLRVLLDAPLNEVLPADARIAYDVPRALGVMAHDPRWVVEARVHPSSVASDRRMRESATDDETGEGWWRRIRRERLDYDYGLCVFCKGEAEEVHHVTYERRGAELLEDLRSLCGVCHDACTALEYGTGMTVKRVDPLDPAWRARIAEQIDRGRAAGTDAVRQRVFESLAATRRFINATERGVHGDVSVLPED